MNTNSGNAAQHSPDRKTQLKRPQAAPAAIYRQDANMTSIVSYPTRCKEWGDGNYRGNCDGRLFKNLVLRYQAQRVADPMAGSGTTRDVIRGLNRYAGTRIRYWAGDLKSGFNLLRQNPAKGADFIWIHPPYWNIIRYSDHPDDLSTINSYPHFLEALEVCLRRCHDSLTEGGRLAVLVGDVRRRGAYTPLGCDVMSMAGRVGVLRSVIIKTQHNCKSDAITYASLVDVPIKHEYCIVFQKA